MVQTRRAVLRSLAALASGGMGASRLLAAAATFPPQATIDADPLRPRYHLMPRRGWMNDPCAPVYFRGEYHLFFQYNPNASVWGDMHWAHAVSADMVHWSERPLALAPTPGGPDAYGVFTGSMVFDKGVPTILYTCVSPSTAALATLWGSNPPEREQQCLAVPAGAGRQGTPVTALDTWDKRPQPVITTPPEGMQVTGFRDPVPWQEPDGAYYMLLASGQRHVGGNVLLYKSADLRSWEFQHIFAEGTWTGKATDDTVDSGEMWECPDFFPLGGKHVLIHSTGTADGRKTVWQSGTLDHTTMRWTPERGGVLNHGPYYAPKSQLDAAGNRILWGWIEETRPQADFAKAGWAGCMSLPRVLSLENGVVRFAPAPQVASLRETQRPHSNQQAEILLRFQSGTAHAEVGFDSPWLRITQQAGNTDVVWNGTRVLGAADLPKAGALRCFVDHSVVELFLDNVAVLTCRIYGATAAHLQLPATLQLLPPVTYGLQSLSHS